MNILFFTPSFARTGSEIALFNMICNADRREMKMAVAAGADGELLNHLPNDVPRFNYNASRTPSRRAALKRKVLRRFSRDLPSDEWLADVARDYAGYVWYLNTICQPHVLRQARKFGVTCVVHSHELEQMLTNLEEHEIADLVEYPRLLVACSSACERVLRHLGRTGDLEIVNEPVDLKRIVTSVEGTNEARRKLSVGNDVFVWAMSGTLDPNKNPLLFMQVAKEMVDRKFKTHFVWIGGGAGRGYRLFVEGVSKLNEAGNVSWVGARTDDYYDYLNAADGFVLTSSRDSFPLTMIEAAALGKPIVSFNSGGVKEFVLPGMGMVIDSWGPQDLTQAMMGIMRGEIAFDPELARSQAKKFDAPLQAKQWQGVMRDFFDRLASEQTGLAG